MWKILGLNKPTAPRMSEISKRHRMTWTTWSLPQRFCELPPSSCPAGGSHPGGNGLKKDGPRKKRSCWPSHLTNFCMKNGGLTSPSKKVGVTPWWKCFKHPFQWMNSQGPWWPSWHPSCPRVCTGSRSHPPRPPGEPLQPLGLPLQYPRLAIQWRPDPECLERWIGGFAEPNWSQKKEGTNLPNRSG